MLGLYLISVGPSYKEAFLTLFLCGLIAFLTSLFLQETLTKG